MILIIRLSRVVGSIVDDRRRAPRQDEVMLKCEARQAHLTETRIVKTKTVRDDTLRLYLVLERFRNFHLS